MRMFDRGEIASARMPNVRAPLEATLASNVPHGVETITDTMVLDTFSPPQDDYLALDEQARANS